MELSVSAVSMFGHPKKAKPAETIKFNRFNLTFNSDHKLKEGQLIYVNLSAGSHSLREVSARVVSCERCGPHYQTSVKFVLERPDKKPYTEAISILKSIEQALPNSLLAPTNSIQKS